MTIHPLSRRRRGVTLVELMVALLISFILVGAAAYLYLSTRESERAIDEATGANDTGMFVMQLIGRELMTAGFFPAHWNQEGKLTQGKYSYIAQVPNAGPYQYGIFGCEGKRFDPESGACKDDPNGSQADSVVFSYFTLDPGRVGQREDCQGTDVAKDEEHNKPEVVWGEAGSPSTPNAVPVAPMLVANAFHLNATTVQVDGRNVGTRSFSCFGNGNNKSKTYQPIVSGVEDLQITYGLAAIGTDTLSPERFVNATDVGANWNRVVAVRVCVLVHSLAGGTKLAQDSSGGRSYVDCNGTTVAQTGANASTIYKTYVQTFGVRNHQTATY